MYIPTVTELLALLKIVKESVSLLPKKDKQRIESQARSLIKVASDEDIKHYAPRKFGRPRGSSSSFDEIKMLSSGASTVDLSDEDIRKAIALLDSKATLKTRSKRRRRSKRPSPR